LPPAKVAAAIVVDAAWGALGLIMFERVNDASVPAVSPPAVNVTVRTLDIKVAPAAGVPVMPVKPETAIVVVDVNPVRVTTTLLKLATLLGVKDIVMVEVACVIEFERVTITFRSIATNDPDAVVSRTLPPAKVAAAIVVDAARGTLGLIMFERVNDAACPTVRVPAVNVTVRTLDIKVAVAAGVPVMPVKPETAIVVVDVNPVRVTTTLLKFATLVGVKVTVTGAGVVPATAFTIVTPKEPKLGVIATNVPDAVVSRTLPPAKVAAAIVVDPA